MKTYLRLDCKWKRLVLQNQPLRKIKDEYSESCQKLYDMPSVTQVSSLSGLIDLSIVTW